MPRTVRQSGLPGRLTRALSFSAFALLLAACSDHDRDPTAVPVRGPSFSVQQLPGFSFLAPIGTGTSTQGMLGTLSPTIGSATTAGVFDTGSEQRWRWQATVTSITGPPFYAVGVNAAGDALITQAFVP